LVDYCRNTFELSIRKACKHIGIRKTVYGYQPDTERDKPVIAVLLEFSERYPQLVLWKKI